jgi:polysaccharide transporter, PST family
MSDFSSPVEEFEGRQRELAPIVPVPSRARTIFRNFASLSAAAVFSRLTGLTTNAVLARRVSASGYGVTGIAQSVTLYFNLLSDLGLGTVAVREGAQNPGKLQTIISAMLGLRLALAIACVPLGLLTARYLPYSETSRNLFRIYLFTLPIQALSVEWVFRSVQKMYLNTALQVFGSLLTLVLTLALVRNSSDLILVAGIAAIASAAMVALGVILLRRQGYHAWPSFSLRECRYLLGQSMPLCATSVAATLYSHANNLILGAYRRESEVGLYVAATRLSWVCYSPVWFYFTAVVPALAEAWTTSVASARSLLVKSVRVTSTVSIAGGLAAASVSQWVITRIFGKPFSGAVGVFNILVFTGVILTIGHNWAELCIAAKRNRLLMQSTFLGAVLNLAVCASTVSAMGGRGAALGNLVAEAASKTVLIFAFGWHLGISVLWEAARPLAAGAAAYAVMIATRSSGILLCPFLTLLSYLSLLLLIGGVKLRDFYKLRSLIAINPIVPDSAAL